MRLRRAFAVAAALAAAFAAAADRPDSAPSPLTLERLKQFDPPALARAVVAAAAARPDYSAVFERTERIDGALKGAETARVKLRSKPFSVHIKWTAGPNAGREALYVEGKWSGAMALCVNPRLPILYVRPDAKELEAYTRHPITQMGLGYLASRMVEQIEAARKAGTLEWTVIGPEELRGRRTFRVRRKLEEGGYRYWNLDAETWLPLRVWSTDAGGGLVERYEYRDIDFNVGLSDDDFDPDEIW